jgi:UDP-N-acetyl-D-mannosaminuronic acid dehydrogenase
VDPDNARLIETARRINDEVPRRVCAEIRRRLAGLVAPRLAIVGAAYKPDTADCRESPALRVVEELRSEGFDFEVYDPLAPGFPWPGGGLATIADGVDCLIVLTEHTLIRDELATREPEVRAVMRHPLILRFYPDATEDAAPWQALPAPAPV